MGARIIPVTVENDYMIGAGVPIGSAGSAKDVSLQITFGNSWDGYEKRINWVDSHGENATLTLLTDNLLESGSDNVYIVPVPAGPKTYQGNMMVTVQGYMISGGSIEQVQVSTTAYFKVLPSDWKLDDDESIDPTVAQQLQAAIDSKQDILTFDDMPTFGSNNPVKSGGVFNALALEVAERNTAIENAISAAISGGSIFIATQNETSYADVIAAKNAGKTVFARATDGSIYAYCGMLAQVILFTKICTLNALISASITVCDLWLQDNDTWYAHEAAIAPLNSPALTGTPTAPTAASGTSTEQIATTGFVRQEIDGELDRLGVSIVDGALCQTYSS